MCTSPTHHRLNRSSGNRWSKMASPPICRFPDRTRRPRIPISLGIAPRYRDFAIHPTAATFFPSTDGTENPPNAENRSSRSRENGIPSPIGPGDWLAIFTNSDIQYQWCLELPKQALNH